MIPWKHLDTATVPGGGELKLMQRGHEFWIMAGPIALMTNRLVGSEQALAEHAAARLKALLAPRLLIGGLGMGFTLRAALRVLPAGAELVVAELVPAIITWARGPLAEIFAGCLDDRRVKIELGDVAQFIRAAPAAYDAILLDVDNGPDGLTRQANDGLYSHAGLAAAYKALRPGGLLAVWSSGSDDAFTRRLKAAGFAIEATRVRAHGSRGPRHMIWLAGKPSASR